MSSNEFTPIIANLCNASFDQRTLLVDQKKTILRPLLKKPSLDMSDLNKSSYLEAWVCGQTSAFCLKQLNDSLMPYSPPTQRTTHYYHSTNSPALNTRPRLHLSTSTTTWWQSSIEERVGAFVLLDMWAAFDTINHHIMLEMCSSRFRCPRRRA